MNSLRGEVAIVGTGHSKLGKIPGATPLGLMTDAASAALADAGLEWEAIDGLVMTAPHTEHWSMPTALLADAFGIKPRYFAAVDLSGASGPALIHQAALAIAAGECETVLCVAGDALLSHRPRSGPVVRAGPGHPQYESIYEPSPPSLFALLAQRHMAQYGTTPEQLAEVAVSIRAHAALNPDAQRRETITIGDVLASRVVSSPLHVLDCSLVSDGAGAAIVTSRARARDITKNPVFLLGQGYGLTQSYIGDAATPIITGAVQSGRKAFASAGLSRRDIDVAQLYDCFTITVIIELEDLGFCAKGEGGAFVSNGRIAPGGALPVTTHGGLLSCAHPGYGGGLFHVLEGVRQLQHVAGARQVANAKTALVHGNAGVFAMHCTLILGTEDVL